MLQRLQRLVRDLAGRNDEVLIGHLVGQVDQGLRAVDVCLDVAGGATSPRAASDDLVAIEREQDEHRDTLVRELSAVLAPPVDREDLTRLSRSIDDVLANLVDLNRELDLFGLESRSLLVAGLRGVRHGLERLGEAIEALVDEPGETQDRAREAKDNGIRAAYQEAVAELLNGEDPVTPDIVKQRIVLRRVDVVGLRVGEAADALIDGTIKRNT